VVIGAGTLREEGYGGLQVHDDSAAWRRARGMSEHPVLVVGIHAAGAVVDHLDVGHLLEGLPALRGGRGTGQDRGGSPSCT
jgi:hypothetical protein